MGARLLRCTRNDDFSWGCNLIGVCCRGHANARGGGLWRCVLRQLPLMYTAEVTYGDASSRLEIIPLISDISIIFAKRNHNYRNYWFGVRAPYRRRLSGR